MSAGGACRNRTTADPGRDDRGIPIGASATHRWAMRITLGRRVDWMAATAVLVIAGLVAPAGAVAATDSDRDGLPNDWERTWSLTNPLKADTDGDGLSDATRGPGRTRLTNRMEWLAGLAPAPRRHGSRRHP